jgi:NarL family two-component system response regulator YdfI
VNELGIMVVAASEARRSSLARLLREAGATKGWTIVTSASLSLEKFGSSHASILVADLTSGASSVYFLKTLKEFPDGSGTVALVDDPDPGWVRNALHNGVHAIIARDSDRDQLALAVEAADAAYVLLHPTSARMLSNFVPALPEIHEVTEHLTPREKEVLGLISGGLGNKGIAVRLGISEHTVKFHTSSILAKLSARSRTEAVSQGIKRGLISL